MDVCPMDLSCVTPGHDIDFSIEVEMTPIPSPFPLLDGNNKVEGTEVTSEGFVDLMT